MNAISKVKKIPGVKPAARLLRRNYVTVARKVKAYSFSRQTVPFTGDPDSNVIVSLTTFPARIDSVWITIESLFQQEFRPWKIILVLAEEEFPDNRLPASLLNQVNRGLEIIWTEKNSKSYKKLLPTRKHYPGATIITVDDDVIYERWRIGSLVAAREKYPDSVIGHRGWEIGIRNGDLDLYTNWRKADETTSFHRTMLTGVGGILYPPGILDEDLLLDIESAEKLCPTGDDIWFWATAVRSKIPVVCLGNHRQITVRPEEPENSLYTLNRSGGKNDLQLGKVVKNLELWEYLVPR